MGVIKIMYKEGVKNSGMIKGYEERFVDKRFKEKKMEGKLMFVRGEGIFGGENNGNGDIFEKEDKERVNMGFERNFGEL